jgi:hypothetical protein
LRPNISSRPDFRLVATGGKVRRGRLFSMLCASGFEFEEKLRLAAVEQANAQRAPQSVADSNQNNSKRFEDAAKRYNKRLSDFVNHTRACTLCRDA